MITIAVTPGEPAGIGPDLCIQLAAEFTARTRPRPSCRLALIADPDLIASRIEILGANVRVREYSPGASEAETATVDVIPVAMDAPCTPGQLNRNNAGYVLRTLDRAVAGCLAQEFQGLVTGPVQKSIINDAGIAFSGHTEYLAAKCETDTVVMMLATEGLRVALATTHLPLAAVPRAITRPLLTDIITVLHRDLIDKFGITSPRILVTGLNPHAGENGHLGREEIDTIIPVIAEQVSHGVDLVGPLPADTLFTEPNLAGADAVLAMYHDQGLPVLKYKGFGHAVNITLGLPIIRTSVDHGTALALAGSGKADTGSLWTAINTATTMAGHWSGHVSP